MSYSRLNWEDTPSTKTPINAENLNKMDQGIFSAHEQLDAIPDWAKEKEKPSYTPEDIGSYTKEEIDALKATSIISKVSGEVITTTDSTKAKIKDFKLFGKCEQRQYVGNQLFDASRIQTTSKNGVVITNNGDGSITISGSGSLTNSVNEFYTYSHEESIKLVKSGILSLLIDKQITPFVYAHFYYANESKRVDITLANTNFARAEITEEMLDDTCYLRIGFYGSVGAEIVGGTIKPMLYQDGDGTWEPFVGGEQSPNMKYPQKVEFHGESGSIGGKVLTGNLFELTEDMMWKCALLDTQTCSVRLNYGVGGYYATLIYRKSLLRDLILNNQGKPFTFACDSLPSTHRLSVVINGDRKNGATYYEARTPQGDGNNILSFTVTDFNSIDSIDFRIGTFEGDASDTTTIINGLRFHIGNNEMSFSPYTEQPFTFQTPNGLRGIPLGQTIPDAIKNSPIHMNGVYWDSVEQQYYIADTKNENGNDVQIIGKSRLLPDKVNILDSYCNEESNFFYMSLSIDYLLGTNVDDFICDIATYNPRGGDITNINNGAYLNMASRVLYIRLRKDSGVATLDEFKEYLTNNEVYVYLILDEPIVTETDVQYDVVMNYPNTTIVNNDGAYMEVEYVADTQEYIKQNYVPKEEFDKLQIAVSEIQLALVNS